MTRFRGQKLKTFRCYSHQSRNKPKPVPPGCNSGGKSTIHVPGVSHGRSPGDGDENSDGRGSSPRRCLDGTRSIRAPQSRTHLRALGGVKRCVCPRPSREKPPTRRGCRSQVGRFHLRPCHRLQLPRRSSLLAPGSCSACSRQLANTVGREAPGEADSLPALRWSSRHSPAFPRRTTTPTKQIPTAAEPSCLQMIDVPSASLGHTVFPAQLPPTPATILGNWPVTSRAREIVPRGGRQPTGGAVRLHAADVRLVYDNIYVAFN